MANNNRSLADKIFSFLAPKAAGEYYDWQEGMKPMEEVVRAPKPAELKAASKSPEWLPEDEAKLARFEEVMRKVNPKHSEYFVNIVNELKEKKARSLTGREKQTITDLETERASKLAPIGGESMAGVPQAEYKKQAEARKDISIAELYAPKKNLLEAQAEKARREQLPKIDLDTKPAIETGYSTETLKTYFPELPENRLMTLTRREARDRQKERLAQIRSDISSTQMTADMKNRMIVLQEISPQIDILRNLLDTVPSGLFEGGLAQLKALTGQTEENLNAYESSYRAIAVGLYRAVTGDTRLSDQDASERGYKLFPRAWESESVRESIWNQLYRMIENATAGRTFVYDEKSGIYRFNPQFSNKKNQQPIEPTPEKKPQPSQSNLLTPEIAKQLLQEAGGNKNKARALARNRGYQLK